PLDRIWNLDFMKSSTDQYLDAAVKIRHIYGTAYPDLISECPADEELRDYIKKLIEVHPEYSRVSTWRVVVTGTVEALDAKAQGEELVPAEKLHDDIMDKLKNL